jgi:hypothetical protein
MWMNSERRHRDGGREPHEGALVVDAEPERERSPEKASRATRPPPIRQQPKRAPLSTNIRTEGAKSTRE